MKTYKVLLLVLCSLFWIEGFARIKPYVDECHELSGIVWRLAGAEEYVSNRVIESYSADIEAWFGRYKDHPLMDFIRSLRQEPYLIGFNGVPGVAVLLQIDRGRIVFKPGSDLNAFVTKDDSRWTEKAIRRYVALLDDFYRTSHFRKFFLDHRPMYEHAEKSMEQLTNSIDTAWFESFYGQPFGNPKVLLALSYGFNNFSLPAESMKRQHESGYGIVVGCISTDREGWPVYNFSFFDILLHEFCHNFTNPIVHRCYDRFEQAADTIFPHVADQLNEVGYGNASSMIVEGLNNLFVCMYHIEALKKRPLFSIGRHERFGFVWMSRAIGFMDNFRSNREFYPTIEAFLPELAGFMDGVAADIDRVMREFEERHPYVVSVYPAQKTGVPTDIKEIRVHFSKPMFTAATSAWKTEGEGIIPLKFRKIHWADERTYVMELQGPLEKNKTYGTRLTGDYFYTKENGHEMNENIDIVFKTEE